MQGLTGKWGIEGRKGLRALEAHQVLLATLGIQARTASRAHKESSETPA